MTASTPDFSLSCPVPIRDYPHVLLAHGGGGKLMQQLIEQMFFAVLGNPVLDQRHDAALLELPPVRDFSRLAFTTDTYVVRPLFFPGGDIGSLAVFGTVNDLSMAGARPMWLSAGFILEEGLPMETLWRAVQSMAAAARTAGVMIVTGDTKVVDRGKADGLFINTAGIGLIEHDLFIAPRSIQPGDIVLLSGDIGRHGMAIMAQREGLQFESAIKSDAMPLWGAVEVLLKNGIGVHCLRDLTRGGLGAALIEISEASGRSIEIDERAVPVGDDVRGACEILGLDPLFVANEGRFIAIVAPDDAERALSLLRSHPSSHSAVVIGGVRTVDPSGASPPRLYMKSVVGTTRIVDKIRGEQLPRIC